VQEHRLQYWPDAYHLFRDRRGTRKGGLRALRCPDGAAGDGSRERALPLVAGESQWEVIGRIWYEGIPERRTRSKVRTFRLTHAPPCW
jgi:hypothetical protein